MGGGMKKLLLSRFDIIEVNEFNTSKLYNKTLKEMENVSVKRKKHKKSLHEILTPKEETNCRIFVNRDVNACKNILLLGKCYLESQTRQLNLELGMEKTINSNQKWLIGIINKEPKCSDTWRIE